MNPVEGEDLFRDCLILGEHQPMRARAGVLLPEKLEKRRYLEISGVIVGERFAEIEDQVAVDSRQREEAFDRAVDLVKHWLVTEFDEGLVDFLFNFFLVERTNDRGFLA